MLRTKACFFCVITLILALFVVYKTVDATGLDVDSHTVLLLQFNDNFNDDSLHSNHGKAVGSIKFEIEDEERVALFEDGYIEIPNNEDGSLVFGPESTMTIEMWVKPSRLIGYITLLKKYTGGNYRIQFSYNNLSYQFYAKGNWNTFIDESTSFKPNIWTHIAITHDSSKGVISFFKDGKLTYRVNTEYQLVEDRSKQPLYIGGTGSREMFYGCMDEIRLSNCLRYDPEQKASLGEQVFHPNKR